MSLDYLEDRTYLKMNTTKRKKLMIAAAAIVGALSMLTIISTSFVETLKAGG